MSQLKTKEFKKLQRKWYAKAKASGFQDIERNEDELHSLTSYAGNNRYNPPRREAWTEYYRLAGQFLNEWKFESASERLIWELHAEGYTIREIAALIKKHRVKIKKSAVGNVIKALYTEMINKYVSK